MSSELVGFSNFPHLQQVCRIERIYQKTNSNDEPSRDVRFAVTSLSANRATPARLLSLARGHWSIENKLHHVRDRTFDEDRSQVRKNKGPRAMASLRNIAISILRLARISDDISIAAASRHCRAKTRSVLRLIGVR